MNKQYDSLREVVVKPFQPNTPGYEYSAHYNGKGYYGATAEEAEAKLRANTDCEGVSTCNPTQPVVEWNDGEPVRVSPDGIIELDIDNNQLTFSPSWGEITAWSLVVVALIIWSL